MNLVSSSGSSMEERSVSKYIAVNTFLSIINFKTENNRDLPLPVRDLPVFSEKFILVG